MKEKSYLLDSNIIIYHLINDNIVKEFLFESIDFCSISVLTYIEVLSFHFQNASVESRAKELLESFNIIYTNKDIAIQSIKNRRVKKIKLPDNIIASTAQIYKLTLVSRNEKDFKSLDVEFLNPFDNLKMR